MVTNGAAKRKSNGDSSKHPKKKVAIEAPAPIATVSSFLKPESSPPIIAFTHGLHVPANTEFTSYSSRAESNARSKSKRSDDLLLHSTAHPYLDYTAKEDSQDGPEPKFNHFVGIYDPESGRFQVVEAKKMTVRGTVRARQDEETLAAEEDAKKTMLELRTELGQIFGTKKAKKALQDRILNDLSPQKQPNGERIATKIDDAARFTLNSMGDITSTMPSREELQAVVDQGKPGPKANLEAEDIADVYDPKVIIGGDILNLVPIREWQEKARHNESIQAPSRYVVARVVPIALNEEATTRLRVLRYYYFVLLFWLNTKPGKQRGVRQLPSREKLKEALSPAPEAVIENIRRKFSEAGEMRQIHQQRLLTHCCVFACIVDNFEVDTQNLRDDLRQDQKAINQYFHEIGARVKPVTNKADNRTVHMAKLTLPLDFPKQRHIAQRRR